MKKHVVTGLLVSLIVCTFAESPRCDIENRVKWNKMNGGTSEDLLDVWGTSASDVYAIGKNSTILHFNGNSWRKVSNGLPESAQNLSITAVGGSSATDAYALAPFDNIFYLTEGSWRFLPGFPSSEVGAMVGQRMCEPVEIWSDASNQIFAADRTGYIFRRDGDAWALEHSFDGECFDVWVNRPNDIYALVCFFDGSSFVTPYTVYHYDGSAWSSVSSFDAYPYGYQSIWADSTTNVVISGPMYSPSRFDGNQWTQLGGNRSYDICGRSADDIYFVGKGGAILHYDGNEMITMDSGTANDLRALWEDGEDRVFAVGDGGTILRFEADYDFILKSKFDTAYTFYMKKINAVGSRFTYYRGKYETNYNSIGDCSMVYDNVSETITIAVFQEGEDRIFHYSIATPNYFKILYNTYKGKIKYITTGVYDLFVKEGKLFVPQSAKVSQKNAAQSPLPENNLPSLWEDGKSRVFAMSDGETILPLQTDDFILKSKDDTAYTFYINEINSVGSRFTYYRGHYNLNNTTGVCSMVYDRVFGTITILVVQVGEDRIFHYSVEPSNEFKLLYGTFENVIKDVPNGTYDLEGELSNPQSAKVSQKNTTYYSLPYSRQNAAQSTSPQQENVLKLGALLPLNGGLQTMGEAFQAALTVAERDMQSYLSEIGSELTVELLTEDTQTDPSETWFAVQNLRNEGVSAFLGPQDSASLDYMKQFADEEDYLLLSGVSTAAELSIPNDNVMRCIGDDNLQAAALADKMKADGVESIVVVSRADIYGTGMYQALERGWLADNAHDETDNGLDGGFPWETENMYTATTILFSGLETDIFESDLPDTIQTLQNILDESAFVDKSKSAVVLVAYEEAAELMKQAAQTEGLDGVRWYGTDSLAQNAAVSGDAEAAAFAAQTQFTCSTFSIPESEANQNVREAISVELGYEAPSMAMLVYDSYQLAVRAYLEAGSDDPESMKAALTSVAQSYQGVTGDLTFNANGDRATGAYQYWTLAEENGLYYWQSDEGQIWTGEPVTVEDWMMIH